MTDMRDKILQVLDADRKWPDAPETADAIMEVVQARIDTLTEALGLIATHRARCHEYDDDMGHKLRDFDVEDVILIEQAARIALKG